MTTRLSKPLRIAFAGTPDFAVPSLMALAASGHRIVAAYCQPDRPAGRGRKPRACPVKRQALDLQIPVRQPKTLRSAETQAELRALDLDLMVVAAYGLILPSGVLSLPRRGCINVHASLLPRWRGAAPIQRAILAGDGTSGISIMQMDEGLDTGPVLAVSEVPISPTMTGGELHDRLASEGARLLASVLKTLERGPLESTIQPVEGATYADKIDKSDARIDWTRPATHIERQVRAFNPWPVAFTTHRGEQLRIWDARALDAPAAQPPGQVIAESRAGIDVCCGEGQLRITRLQLPGKRPVTSDAFLNAHRLAGSRLG
jgi:methionyl-tRNA formyltransferase